MADALKFNKINEELQQKIKDDRENHWVNPYAFKDENAVRRKNDIDKANLWRPVFVRDTEKIMHLPYYNRYADKTQVFSFKNNDDITRRARHVQFVSRIARNIGSVLGLNLDLIMDREFLQYWFKDFKKLNTDDLENRRMLINTFVNSVVLYDDRIDFYFNYKDNVKTLKLSEIASLSDLASPPPPIKKPRFSPRFFILLAGIETALSIFCGAKEGKIGVYGGVNGTGKL